MNSRDGWLRSPRTAVLLLVALMTVLAAGAAMVWLRDRTADVVHLRGEPMTDAQAAAQVVASAKQIVGVAQLQDATGGYAFVSCKNTSEPPYQVAAYMNFSLPQSNSAKYLSEVAAEMVSHGWIMAPAMGEHFGQKLTKDGVTAIFYRSVNEPRFATMRLYGECRNTGDHRNDNPAWTEVSDQLG
jgi:hypothetical protein